MLPQIRQVRKLNCKRQTFLSMPSSFQFHYHFAIAAEAVNPLALASNAEAAWATINLDAWTLIAISESLN
jgi:hypothetical protein